MEDAAALHLGCLGAFDGFRIELKGDFVRKEHCCEVKYQLGLSVGGRYPRARVKTEDYGEMPWQDKPLQKFTI